MSGTTVQSCGNDESEWNQRTRYVEVIHSETDEIRPARETRSGILFDECGVMGDEWEMLAVFDD